MRAPRRVKAIDQALDQIATQAGWARAEVASRGAAEAMGSRFDINGSIWLSDLLDSRVDRVDRVPAPAEIIGVIEAVLSFRDRVQSRILSVRKQIQRRYADPFTGPACLPGPADTLHTLAASGARPTSHAKCSAKAARAMSGSHPQRFARALNTARAELIFLRDDMTSELQRLGPAATEIERIDAALSRALLVRTRALTERLTTRLEASFEAAFVAAAMALPDGPADDPDVVAAVDAWFVDDGWLRAHVRENEALALALYDRDAEILTHLIDAACEIAAATGVA